MKAWITGMTYSGGAQVDLDVVTTQEAFAEYGAWVEKNLRAPPPMMEILPASEVEQLRGGFNVALEGLRVLSLWQVDHQAGGVGEMCDYADRTMATALVRPVGLAPSEVEQLRARVAELEVSWKAATEYNGRMDDVAMAANRQRDAAIAVLREVEYLRGKRWGQAEDCCPACGAHEDYEHRPECKLAAAIGVSAEPTPDVLDEMLTEAGAEGRLRGSVRMDGWQVFDLTTQKFLRRVARDPGPGDYAWDGVHFSFAESEKGHERAFDPPKGWAP